jgi:hypothetical protein
MAKIPKLGRVTERTFEKGQHHVVVEWIDDHGDRVKADFQLTCWHRMPRKEGLEADKVFSKPPRYLYGHRQWS